MSSAKDLNPLERFSDRVADYVRYRPGYPSALVECLRTKAGLGADSVVADIGSGTGIFTRLMLETGAKVFAIEPNAFMRAAADADLGGRPNFSSRDGTAEATGLVDLSATLVTCAQAFHWFEPAAARREFVRILAPGGSCALVWNTAIADATEFASGYERIKSEFGLDYQRVRHEGAREDRIPAFFGSGAWERFRFDNHQLLDFEGLRGRLRSASYAPREGHPRHAPMMAELRALFDRCQAGGLVRMDYDTELFLGRLQ